MEGKAGAMVVKSKGDQAGRWSGIDPIFKLGHTHRFQVDMNLLGDTMQPSYRLQQVK